MLEIVRNIIKKGQDRKSFFSIIADFYPSLDYRYKLIERAYNDAKDAFRDIKRESGERYFEHLRATTLIIILYLRVKDYRIIIASILHDIVEDVPSWTIERVKDVYGKEIALLVQYMTKPQGLPAAETDRIYHSRFAQAPRDFFLVKLSDRLTNTLTLNDCSLEKRRRKVEETKRFYLPYAEANQILIHELEQALTEVNLDNTKAE
jgi:(p)ppGpp synthase/HD superfamily hydrolase